MIFHPEFLLRVLPYENEILIEDVSNQLKSGTVLLIEPLIAYTGKENSRQPGISFQTRVGQYDKPSSKCYYYVTNDERRKLIKLISAYHAKLLKNLHSSDKAGDASNKLHII